MFCHFAKSVSSTHILRVKLKYMYFVIHFRNLVKCTNCLLLVEGVVGTVLDLSPGETGLHVLGKVDPPPVILPGSSVTQGVV